MSKICVVIPAYNASHTIKNVINGAFRYVSTVIVADDGSTDNTADIARQQGAEVISINPNRGKGNALKLLFNRAIEKGFDVAVTLDADEQHDTKDIPRFIKAHQAYPDALIVGSRMKQHHKIPRTRYNVMYIARFYLSLAANQFIEDTQCGYRLYPLSLIKKINLTTERYVTEAEVLIKLGDIGTKIKSLDIDAIYTEKGSHFHAVNDVTAITAYIISYLSVKWFIEGLVPDRPYTYSVYKIRDKIAKFKKIDFIFQTLTAFTGISLSTLFLIEYTVLPPLIGNNFASIRKYRFGFSKITFATYMLPAALFLNYLENKFLINRVKLKLVDNILERFYPIIW